LRPSLRRRTRNNERKTLKTIALLDADVFAYQAASVVEKAIEWEDDFWTLSADLREAKERVDSMIADAAAAVEADSIVICMSCPSRKYWRHELFSQYKGNRSGRAPLVLREIKKYLEDSRESFVRPGLEADDILGILSTHKTLGGTGKKVIVSTDKDFKTIPGYFYDLGKKKTLKVSEDDADYWHMYQALCGDSTDGYPGCPGVGPKTAEKLLKPVVGDSSAMWQTVIDSYAKKDLNAEAALVQARLARICRATDYDFKRKEVILWEPPTQQ